jgi:hypothetical protein
MAVAGVAVLCWLVSQHHPNKVSFLPQCLFHAVTGLHCIGCGLTRAMHAWLNGDWEQGLAYHPLSVVLIPYLTWCLLSGLWRWAWGGVPKRSSNTPLRRKITWVFVSVLVAFWVVRNIPVYPLTLLAPHELVRAAPDEPSPADPPAE